MSVPDQATITAREGILPDGTKYLMQVPAGWNGTLLLYSYGPPRPPDAPAWDAGQPIIAALLARGYALAGCGTTRFWPLEQNLPNQVAVIDIFERSVAHARRTIAWGQSIGGLMTAALVQYAPERLDGALVLCGTLGGGIGTHNQHLDCTFVFKTLLAPDAPLDLVRIADPPANFQLAHSILEAAQATPEGRARLALAAAMANIPGWFDPAEAEPAAEDVAARQFNQYRWFKGIDWHVFLEAHAVLERRGGGNMAWNTDVDYRALLAQSINREQVEALYRHAGLDLDIDLDTLAHAPRIAPDPDAVAYFERYIVFNGKLGGVPVLTLHSIGDGLVPVNHMSSYRDVVHWAGEAEFLRQLYIGRAGHCFFTTAEVLTALDRLTERIDRGIWPDLNPTTLNAGAAVLSAEHHVLPPAMGSLDPNCTGRPALPRFVDFTPPTMARAYDVRTAGFGAPGAPGT